MGIAKMDLLCLYCMKLGSTQRVIELVLSFNVIYGSKHFLFVFPIQASPDQMEAHLDNGLIIGHAYSITGLKTVSGKGEGTVGVRRE